MLIPCKLEKILHLCIFTNRNNSIVEDNSQGHAFLQSLSQRTKTNKQTKKKISNSREEEIKKELPRIKPYNPSTSWFSHFKFLDDMVGIMVEYLNQIFLLTIL